MKTIEEHSWPHRFSDPEHPPAELEPGPQAQLRSLATACASAPVPSERVTRQAAQRAFDSLPPFAGARGIPRWVLFGLRPGRIATALAVLLVLQLGVALAWKLAPGSLSTLAHRLLGRPAVHSAEPPEPKEIAPAPVPEAPVQPTPGVLPAAQMEPAGAAAHSALAVPHAADRIHLAKHPAAAPAAPAPSAPPAQSEDRLAAEASLVSRALTLASDDPRASLDLLGGYWKRFPDGALRGEAAVAEVGAHLALGENAEALARLDGLARDGFRGMQGTAEELRVARLELMAGAGRCPEALPLLEQELSGGALARPLRGRALLARAACRAKVGDATGNRDDLQRYLREFPDGPRAAEVRRVLGLGE